MHQDQAATVRHAEEEDMAEPAARNVPAGGAAGADADIKAKLVKERDVIRSAAQKGISLKAAQLELSRECMSEEDVLYMLQSCFSHRDSCAQRCTLPGDCDLQDRGRPPERNHQSANGYLEKIGRRIRCLQHVLQSSRCLLPKSSNHL